MIRMLYEFHRKQNAKKPGSVHATYLLTGAQQEIAAPTNGVHSQEDGDTVMQSSPPLPTSSAPKSEDAGDETMAVRAVMLVKEEHLEQAKATFEHITGIHVYSLQAKGLSDMQALAECNRQVAASYASEDPLQAWKQYGTIQNPNVKRRTQRKPPPAPAPVAKEAVAKTKTLAPTKQPTVAEKKVSKDSQESKAESKPASKESTPAPDRTAKSKPAVKRQDSDIFKSFAKGKTKPKLPGNETSAEASPPAEAEDEPMNDFSDDEAEDSAQIETEQQTAVPTGPSKKDKEAELQAMMDQEDEPMEDVAETTDEPDNAIDKVQPQPEQEPQETMTVENGRRRGRRRVMKKKTVKDEDGYLGVLFRVLVATGAHTDESQ